MSSFISSGFEFQDRTERQRVDSIPASSTRRRSQLPNWSYPERCRTASNNVMIVAIATFNESAWPAIGIFTFTLA